MRLNHIKSIIRPKALEEGGFTLVLLTHVCFGTVDGSMSQFFFFF